MDNSTYLFHQTPEQLAKDLINILPIIPEDILFEPFKGEGAFFNSFPEQNTKLWTEIEEGRDFKEIPNGFDWVITNPPFKLDTGNKRVNSFWYILDYFLDRTNKGIAFLGNDSCFSTLTPKRLQIIKNKGWSITKIVVCSIKKWRGRYFFIVLEKKESDLYNFLLPNY
jgi:hypothetical protein